MKKILATAIIAAGFSGHALAADLPARTYTKAPAAIAAPVYNWTGFYIGAHIGGAFGGDTGFSSPFVTSFSNSLNSSVLGGGQIGYNYLLSSNWLVGIEGDISGLDGKRTLSFRPNSTLILTDKTDWLASVTGRLGYTWGAGLLYVKGGVAFRDSGSLSAAIPAGPLPFTADRKDTGYTIGGGLEYLFAPAWSAKIEYQYYDFDMTSIVVPTTIITAPGGSYREDFHTVKAGINYHFN